MARRDIQYEYPPPARARHGVHGGLRVHQCMCCGRFGSVQSDDRQFRCLFCKTITEFVLLEPGNQDAGTETRQE